MADELTNELNAEQEHFWRAAAEGKFLLPRCVDTGKFFFYPREHSPFTGGATEWVESEGLGEVYTCSVNYRAKEPYCIAYIKLDEGPIMLSNVIADDLDSVVIGQRVKVCLMPDKDGRVAPFFKPI